MFSAALEPWQDDQYTTRLLRLKDEVTGAYVTFCPSFGAALNHLVVPTTSGALVAVTLAADTPTAFAQIGLSHYYGTLLCPFPNRVKDGQYSFDGTTYQLALNHAAEGHAIHGLVYDKAFSVLKFEATDHHATATMAYEITAEEGLALGYPFGYYLEVDVKFSRGKLSIKTTVINNGDRTMPIGIGWHPYFTTGNTVDSLVLSMPTTHLWPVDDRMIPTREREDYTTFNTPQPIGHTALDSCFEVQATQAGQAVTTLSDPALGLNLSIWQEVGAGKYNFLQVYTPADRRSIAIEPMTCPPDAFNHKPDTLAPGGEMSVGFGVGW